MPDPIDNSAVMNAITAVNTAVTSMRADIDALKKPRGRTAHDVIDRERIERKNGAAGSAQAILDSARRARQAASATLERIQTARAAAGGLPRGRIAVAARDGGRRGPVMSREQNEHRTAFHAWFRTGRGHETLPGLAVKAALQTQVDADGGFVVPVTMETTIDRVLAKYSTVRSLARVMTLNTATYEKLVNLGGSTAGWVNELAARPQTTTPQLSKLSFEAMEEYANPAATQSLLDDASINIESWIADEVAIKFAEQEGAAFVTGTGAGQPRGFQSYGIVANASYAWGSVGYVPTGAAADFAATNPNDAILGLIYALKRGYRQNASFLCNDLTMAAIRKFKDTTGQYLWQPTVQQGQPATLNGYPIESDDNMPDAAANAYPLAIADWSQAYVIFDRAGIRVLRDPFTAKPYVLFYTTKRVGGGIQNFEAIKLLKCATS